MKLDACYVLVHEGDWSSLEQGNQYEMDDEVTRDRAYHIEKWLPYRNDRGSL